MEAQESNFCIICGKEFYPKCKRQKCCSYDCTMEHNRLRAKAAYKAKKDATIKICEVCGGAFHPSRLSQKYCSKMCAKIRQKQNTAKCKKKLNEELKKERQKNKHAKPSVSIQEIVRKALKEHLTYGKYCQKHGL